MNAVRGPWRRGQLQNVILLIVGVSGAVSVAIPDVSAVPTQNTGESLVVEMDIISEVEDVSSERFRDFVLTTLSDPRSWTQAGIEARYNPEAEYRVVLAEPSAVDRYCGSLNTGGEVSCQNGPVVALNATRWRKATSDWDSTVEAYRQYLVNHEVGHLFGQFHPAPRCPTPGTASAVMEQQTKGLSGCTGNSWPLWWEIELAKKRPLSLAPYPDLEHGTPTNLGGAIAPPPTTAQADSSTITTVAQASSSAASVTSQPSTTGRPLATVRELEAAPGTEARDSGGVMSGVAIGLILLAAALGVAGGTAWLLHRRNSASAAKPAARYGIWRIEYDDEGLTSAVGDGYALLFPPSSDDRAIRSLSSTVEMIRYGGCSTNALAGAVRSSLEANPTLRPSGTSGAAVIVEAGDSVVLMALGGSSIVAEGSLAPPETSNLLWRIPSLDVCAGEVYGLNVPTGSGAVGRISARMV